MRESVVKKEDIVCIGWVGVLRDKWHSVFRSQTQYELFVYMGFSPFLIMLMKFLIKEEKIFMDTIQLCMAFPNSI